MATRPPKTEYPLRGRGAAADLPVEDVNPRGDQEEGDLEDEIIPEGYESEAEFLSYWLKEYSADAEYDRDNREEAEEDLRFAYVDQWDEETRREREEQGRPCITVNTLPQMIGQVVGDRRINRTTIKVIPSTSGSTQVAEVRTGLIKSIENYSRAETIYDAACEDSVACGISNFEITLEYSRNDVFEQDIFLRQLHNPFAVTWDRMHRDPTGRDARHCFVEDDIPRELFKEEFGIADIPDSFPSEIESTVYSDWCDGNTVKICALWIMVDKPATFALMDDGEVEDITGKDPEEYMDRVFVDQYGEPYIRESVRTYAQRWLITGFKILEGPYELPLSRLPIIKVSGRLGRVGNRVYRFGLIRWARDPSLLRNYWRSIAAETLAMAPKAQWIATYSSVKGREEDFREAHLSGDPLLIYNAGKEKPQRIDPPQLPAAVLNEANMNAQDIKDVTGLHDASLGIRSNEVSGKAIMARQREGDVATVTFHDHLNLSIQEAGCVINELIPLAYDTTRIIRTITPEEELKFININDPYDDESPNIAEGKYDVQLITGPSYTTQRMESAESMLETMKTMPEVMSQALDIVVDAQDWPGKQKLIKRFQRIIPAAAEEAAEAEAAEAAASGQPMEPSPEQQMAAQMQAAQLEMAQLQMEAQKEQMLAEVEKARAEAERAKAEAEKAKTEAEAAKEQLRLLRAKADEAEAKAEIADDEVVHHNFERVADIRAKENPPEPSRGSRRSGGGSRSASGSRSR